MALPAIRIVRRLTTTEQTVFDAMTYGTSSVVGAVVAAVDLMPHDVEDLLIFLHNRLAVREAAQSRSGNVLGRLYNKFAGEDPDYIELSGVHLRQTLTAAGRAIPSVVVAERNYKLRVDIASDALDHLKNMQGRT